MDLGSIAIGIGGLLVAAFSVYLTYRGRASPYQGKLYSKQLSGLAEVFHAVTALYDAAQHSIVELGLSSRKSLCLDDETRPQLRLRTQQQRQALHNKWEEWAIFLPNEINEALNSFIDLLNGISVHPTVAWQYPAHFVNAEDPGGLLQTVYENVVRKARKCLGTEPLSQQTLKLIGRHDNGQD